MSGALTETREAAKVLLSKVEQARANAVWADLGIEEQASILAAQDGLASVLQRDDFSAMREGIAALDLATRRYAELIMDAAVVSAIQNKKKGRPYE